ncbi:MAG: VWA domain-containing protein [Acidobacteriota bacterium]
MNHIARAAVLRLCAGTLFLPSVTLSGQSQQLPKPTYETGVDIVLVDLAVTTRSGEPITDLKASDLRLRVDGVERSLTGLRFVGTSAAAATGEALPPEAGVATDDAAAPVPGRRFVFVVDRDQIPAGGGRTFLEAAARFLDRAGPADRFAVWTIPVSQGTLRLSRDRDALAEALIEAPGTGRPPGPGRTITMSADEAYRISINDRLAFQDVYERECSRLVNRGADCPAAIEREAGVLLQETRAQSQATLAALERLIEALGSVSGPKHLLLITTGGYLPIDELSILKRVSAAAATSRVHVHALQVSTATEIARTDLSGPPPPPLNQELSLSAMLATETGGVVVTTPVGEGAFTRVLRELAGAYELSFESIPSDRDGKPHRITVEVATRRGVFVRARREFTFRTAAVQPEADLPGIPAESAAAAPPATAPAIAPPAAAPATPVGLPPRAPLEGRDGPVDPDAPATGAFAAHNLVRGLGAYVELFEREFSSAVAEERYVQLVRPWRGNPSSPADELALEWADRDSEVKSSGPIISRRQLLSDVLLVQLPGKRWVGYRDVAVVDGRPVRDREERVRELFLSSSAESAAQLRRVADESARWNLGDFRRNLNLPTLALAFMHPTHRARFEFKTVGAQMLDGRPTHVLFFNERQRPTLVGTSSGDDVPLTGRVWIDDESGHVAQTELRFEPTNTRTGSAGGTQRRSSIVTRYRLEPGFRVLVPAYMWEWYEGGDAIGRIMSDKTLVECLARYANFRRFSVTTSADIR